MSVFFFLTPQASGLKTKTLALPRTARVKCLLNETELREGVDRLAAAITACYETRPRTIIGVLTGSIVLLADVIRRLDMPLRVGVVQASSYRGESTTRGPLLINEEMMPDIAGRDLLLVDDIFDTGKTLVEVISRINRLKPRSVRTAVLLRKADRCEVDYQPDFVAFDIPDQFVVGYGLDYNDHYRNLPYLALLETVEEN